MSSIRLSPYRQAVAVTTNDTTVIPKTRGLYVGGAGNLVVRMDGTNVTFTGVTVGTILPIEVDQVRATSTTATNILALY